MVTVVIIKLYIFHHTYKMDGIWVASVACGLKEGGILKPSPAVWLLYLLAISLVCQLLPEGCSLLSPAASSSLVVLSHLPALFPGLRVPLEPSLPTYHLPLLQNPI